MSTFRNEHPFDAVAAKRSETAAKIRGKYPRHVPVIVEKGRAINSIPDIAKKKFLVPGELTVNQFVFEIRKHIRLGAEQAMFLFVRDTIPASSALMSQIYERNKDPDGFLYIVYTGENAFGCNIRL